jgi:hypothetical protein
VTDLYDIWQVSSQNQAPSAAYIARSVALDSDVVLADEDLVLVRRLDYAKGQA